MHNRISISSASATNSGDKSAYAPDFADLPVELRDAVDAALQECFDKIYCSDELLGNKLTQVRGPLDSLSKRHGLLLEDAIAHAFAAAGDRYEVSTQVALIVSREAMALVESNQLDKLDDLNLPVGGSHGKRVVIDILAFDHTTGDLHVVSVKRGGGAQGGQAARDARKDLTAAGLMLKNLMLRKGLPVLSVKKVLIDWYGRSGIIARKTVTRETVDAYFGLPIANPVEAMSAYMKSGIAERMAPRLLAAIGNACAPVDIDRTVEKLITCSEDRVETSTEVASVPPSLAECLSVLPLRRQGRQMRSVGAYTCHVASDRARQARYTRERRDAKTGLKPDEPGRANTRSSPRNLPRLKILRREQESFVHVHRQPEKSKGTGTVVERYRGREVTVALVSPRRARFPLKPDTILLRLLKRVPVCPTSYATIISKRNRDSVRLSRTASSVAHCVRFRT